MAWQVSKRVWDNARDVKLNYKVMLLALADKADENGICWPKYDTSYKTLGEMVGGLDRRSAMRLIDNLVETGHVIKIETVGRGNSNVFVVISGLTEAEKKRVMALIGDRVVTITNEESEEKQEEMVTTFTPISDNPVTNSSLNGDRVVTQSILKNPSNPTKELSKDNGATPHQPLVENFEQPVPGPEEIAPEEPIPPQETLLPDTPELLLLFEKINHNRKLRGWGPTKQFKSIEQKQTFREAATRLGFNRFEAGITKGLRKGLTDLSSLVNWIASWETKNKKGSRQNGQKPIRESEPGIIAAAQRAARDKAEYPDSPGPGPDTGAEPAGIPRGGGLLAGY